MTRGQFLQMEYRLSVLGWVRMFAHVPYRTMNMGLEAIRSAKGCIAQVLTTALSNTSKLATLVSQGLSPAHLGPD